MSITEIQENEVHAVDAADAAKVKSKSVIQLILSPADHRKFKAACSAHGHTMTARLKNLIQGDIDSARAIQAAELFAR